jgi:acetyltransferase EpsM
MYNIIIIGGNAGSRLAYEIFTLCNYNILGFIDNYTKNNQWGFIKPNILGNIDDKQNIKLLQSKEVEYFVATGDNQIRKDIIEDIIYKYNKIPINAIHPNSIISNFIEIGYGNMILPNVVINIGTKIGNGNIINSSSIIEHDNIIGNYCQISPNSTLSGYVSMKDNAFIASGSTIIPKVNIGYNSYIAAGSTVIEDVKDLTLVAGVPAKYKKTLIK